MRRSRIVLLVGIAWLVLGILNASRLRILLPQYEPGFGWREAWIWGLPDALLWAVLSAVPIFLARRRPLGRQALPWLLHAVAAILVVFLHGLLDYSVSRLMGNFVGVGVWDGTMTRVRESYYVNLLVYSLVVGITQYLVSAEELRSERMKRDELDAELSKARLQALRMQIRPHFVMNALNTVAGLVEVDPDAARSNLRRLGDLMRASALAKDASEVTLDRELAFTRDYLEIEQARFGDRLRCHVTREEGTGECLVPSLILQPLVENAVVHGVSPKPEGGTVEVRCRRDGDRLRIEVVDDGVGLPETDATKRGAGTGTGSGSSTGIGIENVRRRVVAHYGSDHQFELRPRSASTATNGKMGEPGTYVFLSIPYRITVDPQSGSDVNSDTTSSSESSIAPRGGV